MGPMVLHPDAGISPGKCSKMDNSKKQVEIDGVTLHLSEPDATEQSWIGQDDDLAPASRLLAGRRSARPAALAAADRAARHRQDHAGDGRRPASQAAAVHQPVHRRHADLKT